MVCSTIRKIQQFLQNVLAYDRFVGLIISAAKKINPRGHGEAYIPGWTEESRELHDKFTDNGDVVAGRQLLKMLDENRKNTLESKTLDLLKIQPGTGPFQYLQTIFNLRQWIG